MGLERRQIWLGWGLLPLKTLPDVLQKEQSFPRAVAGHLSGLGIVELSSVFTKQTTVIILSRSERERQKTEHKYKATYSIKAVNQGN